MPQFTVFDTAIPAAIPGAKVVVRKLSDNTIVFNGITDASGQVGLVLPEGVAHTVLAYKTGTPSYDGARVSIQTRNGVLLPNGLGLSKVTARQFKLQVYTGVNTPLTSGLVVVKGPTGNVMATTGLDAAGRAQIDLPADLTGCTATVTTAGLDGALIPLDKIDLLGTVVIVLAPVIGPDE